MALNIERPLSRQLRYLVVVSFVSATDHCLAALHQNKNGKSAAGQAVPDQFI